jgi:phosphoglycerate kinase
VTRGKRLRTLEDLGSVDGRTVLVRCDLNVPLDGRTITDDGRIRAALGTIRSLKNAGAKIVLISHLGRPKGKPDPQYSLAPVAKRLQELLGAPVQFCDATVGEKAEAASRGLEAGEVLLLENLRFNPGETSKDNSEREAFAQQLAKLADLYVSDGFGVVHRDQASVTNIARKLPSAAGELIANEVQVLSKLVHNPRRPLTVVLGGSKVSDKLAVIDNLLQSVDTLLIGGGMAFTFLAARGVDVAGSLLERDQIETVSGYLRDAEKSGVNIVLPTDVVVSEAFQADADHEITAVADMARTRLGDSAIGLDIGPETAKQYAKIIGESATIFWNGPMGVFEMEAFSAGTREVAEALSKNPGLTVVGGGDSASAVRALGFSDSDFSHISTGGGASLEFLEGKTLPGLEVLQ